MTTELTAEGQRTQRIENRLQKTVPVAILAALSRARSRYSSIEHIFHCIQLDSERWVGVAGDGENGCYEYFIFESGNSFPRPGKLTMSDVGYGSVEFALWKVLDMEVA